jgi:hypothetical protein
MLDLATILFWEQGVEVAAPAGRVFARAVTKRFFGIKNALKAAAQPECCFSLRHPDGLQHPHDPGGVDVTDLLVTQGGECICGQSVLPLLRVLGVLPSGPMFFDVLGCGGSKKARRRGLERAHLAFGIPCFDRVYAGAQQLGVLRGLRAGSG